MRKKISQVRGVGYSANVYYDAEDREYTVKFYTSSGNWDYNMPDADYFTDDREDALATAARQVFDMDMKALETLEKKGS